VGDMGLLSTHKLFYPWRYIADSKYQIRLQMKAVSLLTFYNCHSRKCFLTQIHRYVDPNGRRDVTAALPTSGYSFFTSIQNWLNNFSLKLH
jgi:hypothetical protein